MNDFLHKDREQLEDYGFAYSEEDSTDSVRWVYYTKTVDIGDTGCRIIIEIKYELSISDDPSPSADNFYYSFDCIHTYFENEEGTRTKLTRPNLTSLADFATFDAFF